MTSRRLLIQSLLYHWRSHAAVLLCVAVGTSVLCGALLVGDSMRGSLRDITLDRLGGIDFAFSSDRLIGRDLAKRLDAAAGSCSESHNQPGVLSEPALLLRASVVRVDQSNQTADRARGVQLCGVSKRFWELNRSGTPPQWAADWDNPNSSDSIAINQQLARELRAAPGDTLLVRLEKPSEIPREAVLGRKDDQLITLRLTVSHIVTTAEFGNFKLDATQRAPRNAFLPLDRLASAVGHADQANTIVVSVPELNQSNSKVTTEKTASMLSCLQEALAGVSQLEDYGLRFRADTTRDAVSLESRRMVLEPAVVEATEHIKNATKVPATPVLVYLANSIRTENGTEQPRTVPYSTVAALPLDNPSIASQFEFRDGQINDLADDSIILNAWAADDLECQVGDRVTIEYYVAEPARPFETAEATFRVRGIVEIEGIAADQGLVPEYPGITNAKRYADWDPPFPMDLKRIRPRDEEYWDRYRATPKAFIPLAVAERLWGSRFGKWTSMRFELSHDIAPDAPRPSHPTPPVVASLERSMLQGLDPAQFGLTFRAVRADGLAASAGGTDFGGLFIGFSFFLIVSAAILIGLVFRLGVERRAKQVGLLLALGYSHARVRGLLVAEGMLIAVMGAVVGLAGAIGYAWLVMAGLRTWWIAAVGTSLLRLHASSGTLLIGALASLCLAALAVVLSLRGLIRTTPRALLAGNASESVPGKSAPGKFFRYTMGGLVVAGTICAIVFGGEWHRDSPVRFFILGVVLLLALLVWIGTRRYGEGRSLRGSGAWAIAQLALRNASRNHTRTILTVGLVAFATFVIVAIGANRRDEIPAERSAGGARWLVAESSVPLLYDLNTKDGRRDLGLPDDSASWMNTAHVYRFRAKEGEDASCLNLYQPKQPRLLGVSESTLKQVLAVIGGWAIARSSEEGKSELERDLGDNVIPAIGDANSVKWILHLGLGDSLPITAEDGRTVNLQIVGLLDRSVFQSELIISESNFQKLFPSQVGYSVFLIEQTDWVTAEQRARFYENVPRLSTLLEDNLADYGFDATPVAERVAEYHAVENTYLATFQLLGGFGLMLGTLGLGAVVLRGVIERRGELALLLAVGYRSSALAWLVLAETAYLLVAGLAVGTVSALVAVAPHLLSNGVEVPFGSLAGTLLLVLAVGSLSSIAAVLATLRTPLLPALRSE